MFRFFQIFFVACLAIALCAAEAPLRRNRNGRIQLSKQRNRFLARQEVVADVAGVTPYPSAKDLIPDIPFDETAAAPAPEGPVEPEAPVVPEDDNDVPAQEEDVDVEVEEEVDEAAASDDAADKRLPDEVYGPPESDDVLPVGNEPSVEEQDLDAAAEEQLQSGRLVFGRRINARNFAARPAKLQAPSAFSARSTSAKSVRSARLVKAKVTNKIRPARLQQLPQQREFPQHRH